jgi:hypothetical protein
MPTMYRKLNAIDEIMERLSKASKSSHTDTAQVVGLTATLTDSDTYTRREKLTLGIACAWTVIHALSQKLGITKCVQYRISPVHTKEIHPCQPSISRIHRLRLDSSIQRKPIHIKRQL